MALLKWIFASSGREGRQDILFRKLIEVVCDELARAFVQRLSMLVQHHIVGIAVVLLIREVMRSMVLNLNHVMFELCPSLVDGDIRAMLGAA